MADVPQIGDVVTYCERLAATRNPINIPKIGLAIRKDDPVNIDRKIAALTSFHFEAIEELLKIAGMENKEIAQSASNALVDMLIPCNASDIKRLQKRLSQIEAKWNPDPALIAPGENLNPVLVLATLCSFKKVVETRLQVILEESKEFIRPPKILRRKTRRSEPNLKRIK